MAIGQRVGNNIYMIIVYVQCVTSKHPVSHAVNLMHKPRCRNQVKTVIGQRASDNIYTMIEVELLGNQKKIYANILRKISQYPNEFQFFSSGRSLYFFG